MKASTFLGFNKQVEERALMGFVGYVEMQPGHHYFSGDSFKPKCIISQSVKAGLPVQIGLLITNKTNTSWSKNACIRLMTKGLFTERSMTYDLPKLKGEHQFELWLDIDTRKEWHSRQIQLDFKLFQNKNSSNATHFGSIVSIILEFSPSDLLEEQKIDEQDLYALAGEFSDLGRGTFERCLHALTQCNGDKIAAYDMLLNNWLITWN